MAAYSRPRLLALFGTLLGILNSFPVWAAPIVIQGSGGGNPDENIVFNKPLLDIGPGNTIQGATNQTQVVLDIMSSSTIVGTGGAGQATVKGSPDGTFFNDVMFIPHSANDLPAGLFPFGGFQDIKFNLDVTTNGNIDITVETNDAGSPFSFLGLGVGGSGSNFFRIQTSLSEIISKVTITTNGTQFDVIKQIRLGGLFGPSDPGDPGGDPPPIDPPPTPDPTTPIPEPTSLAIWSLLALGALGFGVRRRQRRKTKAN